MFYNYLVNSKDKKLPSVKKLRTAGLPVLMMLKLEKIETRNTNLIWKP